MTAKATKPAASKLAAAVAGAKKILGAELPKPEMVKMPKAVHELHVSPSEVIPAGTIITEEIAYLADFDRETVDRLIETGAIVLVDVLASAAVAEQAEEA